MSDIQVETGFTNIRVSQIAAKLASLGMIDNGREKNPKTGRVENFYAKRRDIDALKDKIIRIRDNPGSAARLVTIRRPVPATKAGSQTTFLKRKGPAMATQRRSRAKHKSKLRIAFLATNPVLERPLRTDIEARALARALKATTNGPRIEVNYYPAAEWADLLQSLNEFAPHIVHFSGHGGDGAVVFDNEGVYDDGGVEIDYDLLNRLLGATKTRPDVLVLNACDTLKGAETILGSVKAVVAMSDTIDDAAAAYFAKFMYTAIAEGQPLSIAVDQGKIALAAMQLPDEKLPTIPSRPGVDLDDLKFF